MLIKAFLWLSIASLGLAAAQSGTNDPESGGQLQRASAELMGVGGNKIGRAVLTEPISGDRQLVTIELVLNANSGLRPGEYGLHIHQVGQCSPTFDAAGDHFNPTDNKHGLLDPDGPHAGDLPNLVVSEGNTPLYLVNTNLVRLDEGDRSIFDDDGSAIVIHAQADDYVTDPSGMSGDRIACGIIEEQ